MNETLTDDFALSATTVSTPSRDPWDEPMLPEGAEAEVTPIPKESRNGFAALKKSDPKLYKEIQLHIEKCVDLHDWGYLHRNGKSKPRANLKDTLNFWLSTSIPKEMKKQREKFYPKVLPLSLKRLERHCDGSETVYTCSDPWSGFALIMHDIDDKTGTCGDADKVLAVIRGFFPDAYCQVSTFGKGRHGFSFINYNGMRVHRFRALCRLLQTVIRKHLVALGLKSTYEVTGVPGLKRDDNTYRTCELLAKFPRLSSPDQWRDYLGRRIVHVEEVVAVMRSIQPDIDIEPPSIPQKDQKPHSERKNSVRITISGEGEERGEGNREANPATRMNRCGWRLTLSLGRAATGDEILTEYERLGLNTGTDDDGNRRKLADESADWCAKHYSPVKSKTLNIMGQRNQQLVEQFVTETVRETVYARNRRKYTIPELTAVLSIIEKEATRVHENPKLQFTTPNNSFIAMFKALSIDVEEEGTSQLDKLRAIKSALVEAGLAEEADATWGIGRGKRFGLGRNHPRCHEYQQIKEATAVKPFFNSEVVPCSTKWITTIAAGPLLSPEMSFDWSQIVTS